jgi:hypothetical protein
MSDELLKQARVLIDYADPEVIARQNIPPNAGCVIDGTFYDVRNLVHLASSQADRIEALTAERDQWIQHAKNAVWSDSEELKLTEAKLSRAVDVLSECLERNALLEAKLAEIELVSKEGEKT